MGNLNIVLPPKAPPKNLGMKFQVPKMGELAQPDKDKRIRTPCTSGFEGWLITFARKALGCAYESEATYATPLGHAIETFWFTPLPHAANPLAPQEFNYALPFEHGDTRSKYNGYPTDFESWWYLDITPVGEWDGHWIRLMMSVVPVEAGVQHFAWFPRYIDENPGHPNNYLGLTLVGDTGPPPQQDYSSITTVQTQINYADNHDEWREDPVWDGFQSVAAGDWTDIGPPLLLYDSPRAYRGVSLCAFDLIMGQG